MWNRKTHIFLKNTPIILMLVFWFVRFTETTRDPSAKAVGASFRSAQKQLLIAAKAFLEATEAGYTWSGDSQAELKLVLGRRR